jgi:hypothetical protein
MVARAYAAINQDAASLPMVPSAARDLIEVQMLGEL